MPELPGTTEAPASPPQVGLQPDPAPTSPSPETPASRPGPAAEPTPAGGVVGAEAEPQQTPEGEPQPSNWWTSLESEEALWGHEDAKSRLEESDGEGFKRGRSETQQRMQPFLQKQTQHLSAIDSSVKKIVQAFNRVVKSEDADPQAVKDILDEYSTTFDALRGVHQEAGKWAGAKGVVAEMSNALEDSGFYTEFSGRLESMSQGMTDPTLFPDIVERITASAKEQWMKTERPKLEKQVRERLEAEMRARERGNGKPPAQPAGGGGGGGGEKPYAERLPGMTPAQIDADTQAWLAKQNK